MFVNVSNHPSDKWSAAQLAAAGGEVMNVQFPNVPPTALPDDINTMAIAIVVQLKAWENTGTIMVQGEFSLTFVLTRMLLAFGWRVVVACSERNTTEDNGMKVVRFDFVQFREVS